MLREMEAKRRGGQLSRDHREGFLGGAHIKLKPNEEIGVCKADGSRGNSRQGEPRSARGLGRKEWDTQLQGQGHTASL